MFKKKALVSATLVLCAAAGLSVMATGLSLAETYPSRAIHFIVPFPGGPSDIIARLYAQKLSEHWQEPAVVENRAGATGTIGTEAVVRAAPDGYTLLFTVELPITMAPSLLKLHYAPQQDLVPVAAVAETENVLVAAPAAGIRSVGDLVAAAKARPGKLTFASAGYGSPAHLCGEMIKRQAGIDMVHVPYSAAAPAMNAILSGDVTLFCGPIGAALPFIKAGKAYALGVTGPNASPLLAGVAPLAASYPGLTISNWFGLLAPAQTSARVRDMLQDEFKAIAADVEVQRKLLAIGLAPTWISGADLAKRIMSDTAKWHEFMAAADIHAD